jgi:hypothetical protein
MKENMVERHPKERLLKPEEADMADFLISEKPNRQ